MAEAAALSGNSSFIIKVLERVATETLLHTLTIAEPLIKHDDKSKELLINDQK